VAQLDPRALRPAELARLLNSTPLGEVVRPHVIYRQRNRAGYRIGDGKTIDLVRYVAWLAQDRHAPKPEMEPGGYEALKERARDRNARLSAAGRDIAPLPEIVDPDRKQRASGDFRTFCEVYFPQTFYLPWSPDHLKVVGRIEDAVLRGGLFALAMPRGSGKTSLCERACIWAILYGHRRFVCLIGSDEGHAANMLDTIKTELESNDLLLEDFPEAVYPVQCLEGIANRCAGQLCEGRRTYIEWTAKEIVLPTIPGSAASGAILKVAGITGRIRGMKHQTAEGDSFRPDLVILDDPQTDESARSLSQCQARESILAGAVLGLAGPCRKISGIMPCTVIKPGDMADRILDRGQHPQWQGERMKMVYSFPSNQQIWDRYAEIRAESLRNGGDGSEATEFYRERRDEMDAGAEVAWGERYNRDELSGIQHAINLKLRDEATFWAEYQNEPLIEEAGETEPLDADDIAGKTNGRRRGEVPVKCEHLTAFIDVQQKVLFYVVAAWQPDFSGYVIDYGTYPQQNRSYFTVREVERTLRRVHQGMGVEGAIYAGLEALTGDLLGREWPRDDGAVMRIGRCLIDQGWQTDVVHQFCRQSEHAALLMPARGHGITASQKPISEYDRHRGDRIGHHWWIPSVTRKRALRHVEIDTNYWKSFVHERVGTAMGDPGCLSIFGRKAVQHRLFAEHVTAEYRVRTEGRGRTVDEWKLPAHKPDNHWFDCVVGCAAAASMQGVERIGASGQLQSERKRLKLSEMQGTQRKVRVAKT